MSSFLDLDRFAFDEGMIYHEYHFQEYFDLLDRYTDGDSFDLEGFRHTLSDREAALREQMADFDDESIEEAVAREVGMLRVLASLEAQIRAETNHTRSLVDLYHALVAWSPYPPGHFDGESAHDTPGLVQIVDQDSFEQALKSVLGDAHGDWAESYLDPDPSVSVPDAAVDNGLAVPPNAYVQLRSLPVHEYTHFQQSYDLSSELQWFTEASAQYYPTLFLLYDGRTSWGFFRRHHHEGFSADVALADLESPSDPLAYRADPVLATLDAEIRLRSQERTLASVFTGLNDADGTVTYEDFTDLVATAAGERMDDWLARRILEPVDASRLTMPVDRYVFLDRDRFDIPPARRFTGGSFEFTNGGPG